ncbi:MAG: hypothetical protein ACRCYO_11010 [Bacteroidia bacterium]
MKQRLFATLFLLAIFALDASAQCAMCRANVQTDNAHGGTIGAGINHGILYLMAVPYLLLFLFFRKKIIGFFRELRGLWK